MDKEPLDGDRIFLIRGFLTDVECRAFIDRSERAGYDEATINTASGVITAKDIRDNARLVMDDGRLASELWARARRFMPARVGWCAAGLNERFRCYRYDPGQKFAIHLDGFFRRDNGDQSHLTFMVYLNADFTGGETRFYDENRTVRVAVRPEVGMALAFVHWQLHEGAPVVTGRKYVLRTDVMYALAQSAAEDRRSTNIEP